MKSKEKRNIIIISVMTISIVIFCIVFLGKIANTSYSYTNASVGNTYIQVSNANKISVEEIINNNYKKNVEKVRIEEVELEYITQYIENENLAKGSIQVKQEGRAGIQQITIKIEEDENGNEYENVLKTIITEAPINKIVEVGTSKNKKNSKIVNGGKAYVTSDRAEIMRMADLSSEKVATISKNTELYVIESADMWYKVSTIGVIGWIKSENITGNNPNEINTTSSNETIEKCSFNMQLNKPSGLTLEQFKKILTDSKDINGIFSDNAEYFYYIEQQYNINGIFVAAIGVHESGWGTSAISKNKKNLFGYGAYDSSPYSSSYNFATYSEGIDLIARVLVKYYINEKGTQIYGGETANGKYYNGNNISGVNKKYATDKNWANKVFGHMQYLYNKI